MIIAEKIDYARNIIKQARGDGKTIGLVPTMGALHQGHLSLIRRCLDECDFTAVSIFVNPAQFGPGEDLDEYPRTFRADCDKCSQIGVDFIFAPAPAQMYPQENLTWINVEKLSEHLCGASRPVFFRGVCTVVAKLFNIIQPDVAYFGQKDAQQLAIIRRMVADLNIPVEIRDCPIARADDGLALSSRNDYLTPDQRSQGRSLSRALNRAEEMISAGVTEPATVVEAMKKIIEEEPDARIDYISIVDKELLQPVSRIDRPVLIALAVHIGPTRLIDNISVEPLLMTDE